jgi:hypothetical protein
MECPSVSNQKGETSADSEWIKRPPFGVLRARSSIEGLLLITGWLEKVTVGEEKIMRFAIEI